MKERMVKGDAMSMKSIYTLLLTSIMGFVSVDLSAKPLSEQKRSKPLPAVPQKKIMKNLPSTTKRPVTKLSATDRTKVNETVQDLKTTLEKIKEYHIAFIPSQDSSVLRKILLEYY